MVRLLAPEHNPPSHFVCGPSCREYVVRNGAVEVEEDDMRFLLGAGFRRDL